jgi:hypothetical protein
MAKGLGRRKIGKQITVTAARDHPAPALWTPRRDSAHRDENYIHVTSDVQIYQSLWYDGHQLTDFVLVLQVKNRSHWSDVLKVDCCHNAVHAHIYTVKGTETIKELQAITQPKDLILGCEMAENLVFKQTDTYLRRWFRGK